MLFAYAKATCFGCAAELAPAATSLLPPNPRMRISVSVPVRISTLIMMSATILLCAAARASAQAPTLGQGFARTSPVAISSEQVPVKIERAFPHLQFLRPIGGAFPPDGTNR